MSKKIKVIADLDYVQGHLRYGHLELEIDETKWNALSEKEKIDYINEYGYVIVDDYEIDDYGTATTYQAVS